MEDDSFFYDDFDEDSLCDTCTKCGRTYDHIDYEFQFCSKCGWDEANKKWGAKTEPTEGDYLSGDADILTGRWY